MSAVLPVLIESSATSSASYYCRLPKSSLSSLSFLTSTSRLSLRLESAANAAIDHYVYVEWKGDLANGDHIVLSPHTARELQVQEFDVITVKLIHTRVAANVYVEPMEDYDWSAICSQANLIEEQLLHNVGIVYLHQTLVIAILQTTSIRLKVTSITYTEEGHRVKEGNAIDNSHRSDSWYGSLLCSIRLLSIPLPDNETQEIIDVARLSATTLITVSPFNSTLNEASLDTSCINPLASINFEEICQCSTLTLKILPENFTNIHTGFLQCTDMPSYYEDESIEQYLDECKLIDVVSSDECSELECAVHPLYFRGIISAYMERNSITLDRFQEITNVVSNIISDQHALTCKLSLSTNRDLTYEPFASEAVICLVIKDSVRPGFLQMPRGLRRSLNVVDRESVTIELLTPSSLHEYVPDKVSLRPLYWNRSSPFSLELFESTITTQTSRILMAAGHSLISILERSGRLIMPDGIIITVSIPFDGDDGDEFLEVDLVLRIIYPKHRCDLPSGRFMCISDRGTLMRIFDIFEFTLPIVSIINNRKDHMLSRGDHAILITPLREIRNGLIAGIAPLLSPRAVLERVRTNVRPMSAFMLCGERWSGKTEVALEAARVFSGSPRAIAHVEVISCSALVGKPLRVILEAIQNGLERCYTAGTAVLLVDDVDLICPAVDDRETQPQNIESFVVAHHLELLLNTVMTNNMRSHTEARVRDAPGVLELLNDWLLASALEVVCVLFTAQSPRSVNAALLEDGLISRIFIIPILPSTCLCQSFFSMLHTHSISCELSSAQMEQVQLSLEGFRVGDLVHLSRSIHANTIGSGSSTLSVLNLLQLMRAYVPVSAEKLIKFDTGGLVCWADISGLTEAKATILSTFRRPLIFRKLYNVLPVKMPRAILLYGPPGSGKTMLASAAGNECGMSFAVVKGPELLDKYIGASEKAIRALFAVAKSASRPMLIFFDEFDALAPRRGRDNGGVTDRVVNQLLTFLDGVEDTMRSGGAGDVFVIAATSRPDLIDPALLRPGRIETHIYLGLPTALERLDILLSSLSSFIKSEAACIQSTLKVIANDSKSSFFTSADLKNIANSSLIAATKEFEMATESTDFEELLCQHLTNVFQKFRPSMSTSELERYQGIYKDFRGNNSSSKDENPADRLKLALK